MNDGSATPASDVESHGAPYSWNIYLASPIITSAIVAAVGLERVPILRWIVLAAGFFEVLLVVSPDMRSLKFAAALALGSALFVAFRDIATRRIAPQVPSIVVTLMTTIAVFFHSSHVGQRQACISCA